MAEHFMVDLETMSTAADAAILSIGIQPFDPRAQGIDEAAGLVIHVDLQACMNAGLRVDAATVMWWMTQTDDARAALVAREPVLLSDALRELTAFGQRNGGWSWAKVWGNGAAFDIPILETAFRRCRLDIPWAYNNVLDVRTMKWLAPDVPKVAPKVAHDALSDAQAQAIYVQDCWRRLNGAAPGEEDQAAAPAAASPTVPGDLAEDKPSPLAELWDACQRHDWTHMMSDDPGVYRRGSEEASRLSQMATACGPEGKALYDAWHSHVWKQGERPARPVRLEDLDAQDVVRALLAGHLSPMDDTTRMAYADAPAFCLCGEVGDFFVTVGWDPEDADWRCEVYLGDEAALVDLKEGTWERL